MTFYIPNINPLRFTGGAGIKFDRLFMVDLINKFQSEKCYFQKWNLGDETTIQVLSDYEFTFKIYDLDGVLIQEITPGVVSSAIVGQTFSVYEINLDFDEVGRFYAVIEYSGGILISEAWEVGEFKSTLLFKYKNSENNYSVIFDTGIEFFFRVEGVVADFEPKSDDVIYNDQLKNSRILDSVPWRSFQMYIGNAEGVPDWVADKANRIMACDVVHVDSETFDGYISKVEGAEWETQRAEEYAFIGLKTEIMTVENDLLQRLKRGTDETNIKIVQKVDNYYDLNGNVTISGVFAKYRLLEKICIEKAVSSPDITVRIGITSGGDEVGEFEITDQATTILVNYLFLGSQTVYISGITVDVPFLSVIYKNLIEQPIGIGDGEETGGIPIGAQLIYSPRAGRAVTDDFDILTGLGREGTAWFGWAVNDGRNGTDDMRDLVPVGFSENKPFMSTGGTDGIKISTQNLPEHEHWIAVEGSSSTPNLQPGNSLAKNRTSGGNSNAHLGGIVAEPTLGRTSKSGKPVESQEPINIQNPYRAVMWVTKIA